MTVIISDLHLGSEVSRAEDALEFLQTVQFRRLILLGDIFADLNFSRLTKEHWEFLGYIRKLSNPKHGVEVVWVEGNHDPGLTEVMSHLVGIRVCQEYAWEYAAFVIKGRVSVSSLYEWLPIAPKPACKSCWQSFPPLSR